MLERCTSILLCTVIPCTRTSCFLFLQIFYEERDAERIHEVKPTSTLGDVLKNKRYSVLFVKPYCAMYKRMKGTVLGILHMMGKKLSHVLRMPYFLVSCA